MTLQKHHRGRQLRCCATVNTSENKLAAVRHTHLARLGLGLKHSLTALVCLKQTAGPKIVTRVERGTDVGHKTKAGEYKTNEKGGNHIFGKDLKSL